MKYGNRFTLGSAKIIGSLMTIVFSFIAFTYGQSCTLLPGWTPSTLADGQSRTGYQISEATYTQSCTGSVGIITCISGSVAYGNTFRYPSCIPHTWANCTTPTGANHLEYKRLYTAGIATYTQTCQQLSQNLQCLNGIFTGGITPNLFSYATCTDPNRAQCIDTRTTSYKNHGEIIIGYTNTTPPIGQSCSAFQKNLTCYNGTWSGGNQSSLYSSCNEQQGAQCLNIRNGDYVNHGSFIVGYMARYPVIGQSCTTLQKNLQCNNGTWSGGNQSSLYSGCTNPNTFLSCTNPRTNSPIQHNFSLYTYTSPQSIGTGTCNDVVHLVTCINGALSGWQAGLYTGCVQANTHSCPNIISGTGMLIHGSFITKYTQQLAFATNNQYCSDFAKTLQCVNGTRSGNHVGLFIGCQNVALGSCLDPHTNKWIAPFGTIYRYTANQPTATQTCYNLRKTLTCSNGTRIGGDINLSPTCGNCILPRGSILPEGQSAYGYSTILWSATGHNYIGGCAMYSGQFLCTNSVLQGTGAGGAYTPSNFPYSLLQCQAGIPKNCTEWAGGTINHGQTITGYSSLLWSTTGQNYTGGCNPYAGTLSCINGAIQGLPGTYKYTLNQCTTTLSPKNCTEWAGGTIDHTTPQNPFTLGYSVTGAIFPKTCEQNYSTQLICINGILNGNWQSYQYPGCIDIGGLVSGIDLAIDESPGLPGQENISGALIAQGSSPQFSILFKNKGTDAIDQAIANAGFLSCTRKEQNLSIYKSNPITSFVVNPGTKVGVNIRLSSLFTQAVGIKTVECKVDTTMLAGNVVIPGNDIWSGKFEIIEADRFDLALSKSIESISKNLEAAEGAKGAQGAQNFLFNTLMNVLVPLIIIIGILSAILGFYKIMFSSEDSAVKEGTRYIIYGVIGIILIMSAKFIGQNVFDLLTPTGGQIKGYEIASGLYDRILYPFIKLAIYLVLGAMFIILISRVITFLFGSDSDAQKKAGTLIGWNVISMLVIIGAKQIVQAIYGKQADVVKDITNLGEVGSGILADKNIPIIYQVINYALGIASLVILVIIIIQTVQLLMKPDDPAQVKNIKNSLLYMFIGILVLGAGYLIVNFAIIN